MKRATILLAFLMMPSMLFAQTFFNEDFSGNFPPSGWTIDSHSANWESHDGNDAGGSAPEAVFNWDPQFNGSSRLISPEVDLTGVIALKVEFKYMIDHYDGPYSVGVATRSGGGSWHTVWQIANPSGSIPATTEVVNIDNGDVGAADFQICWFFSGSSYNINYWYLDDFSLFQPLDHDMRVKDIVVDAQYEPGSVITPIVVAENFGTSEETFDVTCEINVAENNVYSEIIYDVTLGPGAEEPLEFPEFTASYENELYEIIGTTILDGDMNELNDSRTEFFNTYTTERDMVVLEIGTGTWCQYCPGAAMGADDLIENGHNVAVVEYHNGDPFQNSDGMARIGYYGISGYPTAVFDGIEKFIGGSQNQSMYPYYLPIVQDRQVINSAFVMGIFGESSGDEYDLTITVDKMATIPWDNMVLQVALTESDIAYNWFGLDHVNFVERIMIPGSGGTALDFSSGDNQAIELGFTFNHSWELENCELTAFIQNLDDKEILQGTKKMLIDLIPLAADDDQGEFPMVTELGYNYPNPFNAATTLNFSLNQTADVTLTVYNVVGQKVRTVASGRYQAGNHSVVWDGRDDDGSVTASGVYFYRLNAGQYTATRKMLMVK